MVGVGVGGSGVGVRVTVGEWDAVVVGRVGVGSRVGDSSGLAEITCEDRSFISVQPVRRIVPIRTTVMIFFSDRLHIFDILDHEKEGVLQGSNYSTPNLKRISSSILLS